MTVDPIRSLKPCPYLHINPPIIRENKLCHVPRNSYLQWNAWKGDAHLITDGIHRKSAYGRNYTNSRINCALWLRPFTGLPLFYHWIDQHEIIHRHWEDERSNHVFVRQENPYYTIKIHKCNDMSPTEFATSRGYVELRLLESATN